MKLLTDEPGLSSLAVEYEGQERLIVGLMTESRHWQSGRSPSCLLFGDVLYENEAKV